VLHNWLKALKFPPTTIIEKEYSIKLFPLLFNCCFCLSSGFFFAEQSLVDAGFLINEEKSIFVPTQKLEWLGILWDTFSK
jgi:hypothetical protein